VQRARLVGVSEALKVAAHEVAWLEREALIGAEIVDPQLPRRRRRRGWLALEEQHVRLDALGVSDAGRQAEQRVDVAFMEQPPADRLAGTALEQSLDDGASSPCFSVAGRNQAVVSLAALARAAAVSGGDKAWVGDSCRSRPPPILREPTRERALV
jgi:hypothetical protein